MLNPAYSEVSGRIAREENQLYRIGEDFVTEFAVCDYFRNHLYAILREFPENHPDRVKLELAAKVLKYGDNAVYL